MKLLHIISSLKRGGAETLLANLVTDLQHTIQQEVIYFHDGPMVQTIQEMGIPVHHVCGFITLYDPLFWWRLWRLVRRIRPDCIHGWLWAANFASRIFGKLLDIPALNAVHNNVDQDGSIRILIDQISLKAATKVIAVSQGVAMSLKKYYSLEAPYIITIANGIDSKKLQDSRSLQQITRQQLGLSDEHFIIGSVGRFVALKNYPLLLHSFAAVHARHPRARLILIGMGPDEQMLRNISKQLHIEPVVLWAINQSSHMFYPLFDCFALSSFKEGISMALLEAMSFGLPCISTNPTSTHDVLTHNHDGLIVPSGDQSSFTDALQYLVTHPAERNLLGQNAHRTVETNFSWATMVKQYLHLYQHINRPVSATF